MAQSRPDDYQCFADRLCRAGVRRIAGGAVDVEDEGQGAGTGRDAKVAWPSNSTTTARPSTTRVEIGVGVLASIAPDADTTTLSAREVIVPLIRSGDLTAIWSTRRSLHRFSATKISLRIAATRSLKTARFS